MVDRRKTYISSAMATKTSGTSPDKRRKYDEAFKAEAPRLASESRSTQAAARQLSIMFHPAIAMQVDISSGYCLVRL